MEPELEARGEREVLPPRAQQHLKGSVRMGGGSQGNRRRAKAEGKKTREEETGYQTGFGDWEAGKERKGRKRREIGLLHGGRRPWRGEQRLVTNWLPRPASRSSGETVLTTSILAVEAPFGIVYICHVSTWKFLVHTGQARHERE